MREQYWILGEDATITRCQTAVYCIFCSRDSVWTGHFPCLGFCCSVFHSRVCPCVFFVCMCVFPWKKHQNHKPKQWNINWNKKMNFGWTLFCWFWFCLSFQELSAIAVWLVWDITLQAINIPFIVWESMAPGAKKKSANLRLETVVGYIFLFAAMSCEIKLNTLQGGVITLDIPITATVRELKAMLLAKHPCQDPIERKILKVELLRDSSIIDDAETLDAAGFFCAESLVTVAYTRNEVEAATKDEIDDIHAQRCFGAKIPCNLTEISRYAFQNCRQLVLVSIEGSVTHIGAGAFAQCRSLTSISDGWVCDPHWVSRPLWGADLCHEHQHGRVCEAQIGDLCLCSSAHLWQASEWVNLWRTLGPARLSGAHLWRASRWVSLWRTLGSVRLQTAHLWWASPWGSLWHTLGPVPLRGAHL